MRNVRWILATPFALLELLGMVLAAFGGIGADLINRGRNENAE